jgi:formate C-acetyltransferase
MTKGITAAMNSCTSLPFELFSGGASTMWDLDTSIATPEIVSALFMTFFEKGGHIFQGNVTDVEELRRAKAAPEQYGHLMVRVGGYSARFVNLRPDLQEEIINRMRHCC